LEIKAARLIETPNARQPHGCTCVFHCRCLGKLCLALLLACAGMPVAQAGPVISSFAFVQEDGSLRISGNRIYLYGIYIPPTGRTCSTFVQPMPCGTRASLALEFRISGDFVQCDQRSVNPDGSMVASCRQGEDDLSEWMLRQGWAVALPDAPFQYAALESIARSRGLGVWGIPLEVIRK
jgi:endonuclease YncB( thermonuclease family)